MKAQLYSCYIYKYFSKKNQKTQPNKQKNDNSKRKKTRGQKNHSAGQIHLCLEEMQ